MPALSGEIADPGQYLIDTRKRIARTTRTSNSSNATITEVEVLRLDGIKFTAGRTYQLHTSSLLLVSSVTGDLIGVRFRYSSTGTATSSSTELHFGDRRIPTGGTSESFGVLARSYNPSSDETGSLLLTVARSAGTGNCQILASSAYQVELLVDDMGSDPGDTGTSL